MLENAFKDQQHNLLQDYIEVSTMLRYESYAERRCKSHCTAAPVVLSGLNQCYSNGSNSYIGGQ